MAVVAGGQFRVEVFAITRDDRGAPTALGQVNVIAWPSGAVNVAWLDDTTVGVLGADGSNLVLREQQVGGPAKTIDAPDAAQTLAPASPTANVRVLGGGVLYQRSGPNWQQEGTGVKVLAVQLGG